MLKQFNESNGKGGIKCYRCTAYCLSKRIIKRQFNFKMQDFFAPKEEQEQNRK